jgi:hypothetical protein
MIAFCSSEAAFVLYPFRLQTSASVVSSMTSVMMIGRGDGRDLFGAGRGQTSR